METEGREVFTSCHVDKRVAVRCRRETVERAGLDDKVLADDCEISRGYYSKVASGEQGDLLGLVYRIGKTRPELRRDFIARLAEHEGVDPMSAAAKQMVIAALRFLRLRGFKVEHGKQRMATAAI